MDQSASLYARWLESIPTRRLAQTTRDLLSELYWDYVDISQHKVKSNPIRIAWKRNRWIHSDSDGESTELYFFPDQRLVGGFFINEYRLFDNRNSNGFGSTVTIDQ